MTRRDTPAAPQPMQPNASRTNPIPAHAILRDNGSIPHDILDVIRALDSLSTDTREATDVSE